MTLVYLHGFASDGGGWKADTLAQFFPQAKIVSPDLSADPYEVKKQLTHIYNTANQELYWFGTSLGGFYAYYASAQFGQKAFLFNPSITPDQTLARGIGHWQSFRKERDYIFKKEYLSKLEQMRQEADRKVEQHKLYFFLAKDDLVLDLRPIPGKFPHVAKLIWYEKGGHTFGKFAKAVKRIRQEGWIGSQKLDQL